MKNLNVAKYIVVGCSIAAQIAGLVSSIFAAQANEAIVEEVVDRKLAEKENNKA